MYLCPTAARVTCISRVQSYTRRTNRRRRLCAAHTRSGSHPAAKKIFLMTRAACLRVRAPPSRLGKSGASLSMIDWEPNWACRTAAALAFKGTVRLDTLRARIPRPPFNRFLVSRRIRTGAPLCQTSPTRRLKSSEIRRPVSNPSTIKSRSRGAHFSRTGRSRSSSSSSGQSHRFTLQSCEFAPPSLPPNADQATFNR